jgi:hypothetical protein
LLYADYFADAPLHGEKVFRRRYRMSRKLFLGIVNSIREFDSYFNCKKDCIGTLGFTLLQKCTTAMRMLAYGAPGDILEDYGRMEEPVFDTEPYYMQGPLAQVDHQLSATWTAFLNMRQEIRDPQVHQELQHDLMEHLWRLKGNA